MKVLLELRPALDGHSGIPQETRLLFRGLASVDGVEVTGLIQSSNLVVAPGLSDDATLSREATIDRLSKVVVSLQQGAAANKLDLLRKRLLKVLGPMAAVVRTLLGLRVPLGVFEPGQFRDFLWRSLFAKSLPVEDLERVTSRSFRVLRWPWSALHAGGVVSAWLGHALYARLDTRGFDVMVVETPYPARVRRPTRMVVRYHDAIPLLMPHTIKDRHYHRAAHFQALKQNIRDGAWFACVSEATRQDLLSVFPEAADRAETIPNMISHHYFPESAPPQRVPEIIWSRKNRRAPHAGGAPVAAADIDGGSLPYLLMVSTIEPRKNHLALLDAWELLRGAEMPRLNLVFVGGLGWDHAAILDRLAPWLQRGGVHLLEDVPAADLRLLYRHASVTVCPSFGEGFDFPGVEAMRCGGVVAASDLPVHRGVFGDACEYFSPYDAVDLAASLRRLIGPGTEARREALVRAGQATADNYLPERVLPQWEHFLRRVAA